MSEKKSQTEGWVDVIRGNRDATPESILRQWRDEKEWKCSQIPGSSKLCQIITQDGRQILISCQTIHTLEQICDDHNNATLARQRLLAELLEGAMHELWNAAKGEKVDPRVLRTIEKRLTKAAKGEK